MTFEDLRISPEILSALEEMGFEAPTPIQEQVIPLQMEGRDLIGQAQTGTGKTAAFGIPLVQQLFPKPETDHECNCDALILAPTRELARQVGEELLKIGRHKGIRVSIIHGGTPISPQIRSLRSRINIVVGTPGRILDHLMRETLDISKSKHLVLDEADEMLDMGFIDDIRSVIARLPENRQTLLFSATMPKEIRMLAEEHMHNPSNISVSKDVLVAPKIDQLLYAVEDSERLEALCRILDYYQPGMALVFCKTRREVDTLARLLQERSYIVEAIHGDCPQKQREAVMQKFRGNTLDVLIATDLAARGIDASELNMVVNYSVPENPETYVHRIGRTGRAGRTGIAVTLASESEERALIAVQRISDQRLRYRDLPTRDELRDSRKFYLETRVLHQLTREGAANYLDVAVRLLEQSSPVELLAAALKCMEEAHFPLLTVDRRDEINAVNTGATTGMVRFFVDAGKKERLTPGDLIRCIVRATRMHGSAIGKISIHEEFSFIEMEQSRAQKFFANLPSIIFSDRELTFKLARVQNKIQRAVSRNKGRSKRPSAPQEQSTENSNFAPKLEPSLL